MPIYEVQDPESGKVIELEGDSPPTEQELEDIFSQYAPKEQAMPEGTALDMVVEPVQAIAGGMINSAGAGLAGLWELGTQDITKLDANATMDAFQSAQQSIPTFAPETQAGQKGLKTVGDLIQAGVDIANYPLSGLGGLAKLITSLDIDKAAQTISEVQENGAFQTAGEAVVEATGSPKLATAVHMLPDIAGALTGGAVYNSAKKTAPAVKGAVANLRKTPKGLIGQDGKLLPAFEKELKGMGVTIENIVDEVPQLPDWVTPKQAASMAVKRKIKAGDTDGFLAHKTLDTKGNIIDDSLAKEATRQGFVAGDVQSVKAANPATNKNMLEMLKIRRKIAGNTELATRMQPSDVIGRSAMARVDYIRHTANKARKDLDNIVKTTLAGKTIDSNSVVQSLKQRLDNLNIKGLGEGAERPILDFKGSQISKDRTSQKVIQDVVDLLSESEAPDALRAHNLKRQLDTMIDFRKKSKDGLTDAGRDVAKAVRHELNQAIRAVDGDYAQANDTLHKALTAFDDYESAMGSKFTIGDINASPKAGLQLRKIVSKYASSEDIKQAVRQMDDLASEMGWKLRRFNTRSSEL